MMAVTAVAAGEADLAWATSPTDTADTPSTKSATVGGAVDVTAAPSDGFRGRLKPRA